MARREVLMLALALAATPALAQDSWLDQLGRATGMISPTPDPPDFVKASRPAEEHGAIPAFAPRPEPTSKVKSAAELKAMDADLESASRRAQGQAPAAEKAKKKPKSVKPATP